MSFSVGIVGLPNAGKTTLFKALTKKKVNIASYPFTTIDPNVGIVNVPDERLNKIASVVRPQKTTETIIEFVDIAGLVKGAHKGEGLGNQFLAHIKSCDAIIEVIRTFHHPDIEHVEGSINPERDTKLIRTELMMKDLENLKNLLSKLEKELKTGEKEVPKKIKLLEKLEEFISGGKPIFEVNLTDEERSLLKEYQFLTAKPIVHIFNIQEQKITNNLKELFSGHYSVSIDLKLEEEASELSKSEAEELEIKSQLDQLILACYNVLDLITFFTVAKGKEVRARTLKNSSNVLEAAGKVHSDFEEKFVRAEIIPWQKLVQASSWTKAKELGQTKIVGKKYVVKDGDVIEFKI